MKGRTAIVQLKKARKHLKSLLVAETKGSSPQMGFIFRDGQIIGVLYPYEKKLYLISIEKFIDRIKALLKKQQTFKNRIPNVQPFTKIR
ncbi:hypothetical protein AKJ42_03210 [candidate division MSBL1 archaeon SCGC-AAA261C02]|uniref:Uncharacterized protein n=1 Tax=candidate division MSBL1 archaeon SCGC-AAA261C02 TaxID=1698272 RepID=A0A133UZ03_9EURY|nr:hypothetical protein AKJ42_03210 [candidate division MSBL1 archaeon SCGC-AAA261C02]